MKKIVFPILTFILTVPILVNAATFEFSPSANSFTAGETFDVAVYVNPSVGEKIYTAKLSATFPANIVEIVSFTQSNGWMSLPQTGYDLVDNTNGFLIKTGGYAGGVASRTQFGIIKLKAKKAGTVVLSVKGDSMILDASNTDKFTSVSSGTYTISNPTVAHIVTEPQTTPAQSTQPSTTNTPPMQTQTNKEKKEADKKLTATTTDVSEMQEDQLAAAMEAGVKEDNNTSLKLLLYYGFGILLLVVAVYLILNRKKILRT